VLRERWAYVQASMGAQAQCKPTSVNLCPTRAHTRTHTCTPLLAAIPSPPHTPADAPTHFCPLSTTSTPLPPTARPTGVPVSGLLGRQGPPGAPATGSKATPSHWPFSPFHPSFLANCDPQFAATATAWAQIAAAMFLRWAVTAASGGSARLCDTSSTCVR